MYTLPAVSWLDDVVGTPHRHLRQATEKANKMKDSSCSHICDAIRGRGTTSPAGIQKQ
jgi:hypothetical protein